ncbi:MAG: hypothetical protein E5299_02480 [Burkholderia gladioli]|nr:MAG: hypothetical protein E5299_02480 [Burkholderia gladioli]
MAAPGPRRWRLRSSASTSQVDQLLERVVDATVPSVISAYTDKIAKLEERKTLLHEAMADFGKPGSTFEESVRTSINFLASHWNLRCSGVLENQ